MNGKKEKSSLNPLRSFSLSLSIFSSVANKTTILHHNIAQPAHAYTRTVHRRKTHVDCVHQNSRCRHLLLPSVHTLVPLFHYLYYYQYYDEIIYNLLYFINFILVFFFEKSIFMYNAIYHSSLSLRQMHIGKKNEGKRRRRRERVSTEPMVESVNDMDEGQKMQNWKKKTRRKRKRMTDSIILCVCVFDIVKSKTIAMERRNL